MCVLTINEGDVSYISQFEKPCAFLLFLNVFECICALRRVCVYVCVLACYGGGWCFGFFVFGCVCVCCGSVGCDCPFLCPEVT